LWSRSRSEASAAAVLAIAHALLDLSEVLVELRLLVSGEDCADLRCLLRPKIHHLGAGRLVRRTTDSLSLLAQFHLLWHILVANGFDLRLLRIGQRDILEHPAAHSATTSFALTLLCLAALRCGNRCHANAECSNQRGAANSIHPSLLRYSGCRNDIRGHYTPRDKKRLTDSLGFACSGRHRFVAFAAAGYKTS